MAYNGLPIVFEKTESRFGSQIIITVYERDGKFVYSVNCRLGRFVRSSYPHQNNGEFATVMDARVAAAQLVRSWARTGGASKKLLAQFDLLEWEQMELFEV